MNHSRYFPTILLAAALMLPHSAAMLCAIFNPMTMTYAVSKESGSTTADADAPAHQCDFAECSTAVVAPVPSLTTTPAQLLSVVVDTPWMSSPVLQEATPPLTPPPIA